MFFELTVVYLPNGWPTASFVMPDAIPAAKPRILFCNDWLVSSGFAAESNDILEAMYVQSLYYRLTCLEERKKDDCIDPEKSLIKKLVTIYPIIQGEAHNDSPLECRTRVMCFMFFLGQKIPTL